jgi:clan AA aspartic protease
MTGMVTAGLQPKLELELRGPSGVSQKVETVIDTGFDGELVLSRAIVTALALDYRGSCPALLADGTRLSLHYYEAFVIWHGRLRKVYVLQSGTVALLGMELLQGSRVTLDAVPSGAVTIAELP